MRSSPREDAAPPPPRGPPPRQRALPLLKLEDPLLDGVLGHQPVDQTRAVLSDAVGAVAAWSSAAGFHQGSSRNT